jgi:hypothetical protein
VERRICTVTGVDSRGLPCSVLVEAAPLFEAAAADIEELHKQRCPITHVQVLVHEPGKRYTVHPQQLGRWLQTYHREDNVDIQALKTRVRGILNHSPAK